MNLTPAWADYLAAAGHEASHWSRIGAATAPDTAIMDKARETGAVVLTHDLDFGAILAATRGQKPSVIQIRADRLTPEAIGPQVVATLSQLASALAEGALVTIDPGRTRVSVLPLHQDP